MQRTRMLWSGDEAVARAARDGHVRLGAGYPGTPSTEILEAFSELGGRAQWSPNEKVALEVAIGAAFAGARDLCTMKHVGLNVAADPLFTEIGRGGGAEWSPNEKVALEVAIGAAFAGARALCTMKHVGLNVAADPLFTVAYTGVVGALVIVSADDPGMSSSQNEQDNRRYAVAAGVPMLEPADSQEAYDFTLLAIEISERWQIPVLLRMTTRVCHSYTVVRPRPPAAPPPEPHFERDVAHRSE